MNNVNQHHVNKFIRSADDLETFQNAMTDDILKRTLKVFLDYQTWADLIRMKNPNLARLKAAAEAPAVMASLVDRGQLPLHHKEITLLFARQVGPCITSLEHYGMNLTEEDWIEILDKCPNLKAVMLHDELADAVLQRLPKSLQFLHLIDSTITGAELEHLELPSLQFLKFHSCKHITEVGLKHLKKFPSLDSLSLFYCRDVTDAWLEILKEFSSLRSLDLSNCRQITSAGIKGLTSLQSLNVSYCFQLNDADLEHIKELTSLQSLELGSLNITDAGVAHLQKLASLRFLNLGACHYITDNALKHLKALPFLQSLNLFNCLKLTNAGVEHLKELPSLQSVVSLACCPKVTDVARKGLEQWIASRSSN